MKQRTALLTITVIAAIGLLFSGFLSYREVFLGTCETNFIRCGSWRLADLPACVYGFTMFTIVEIISLCGLVKGKKETANPAPSQ